MPIVVDFLKAYPEIDIGLVLTDRIVNLLEEPVDLAVRIGDLPDRSLIASRVVSVRLVACGSSACFAARGIVK